MTGDEPRPLTDTPPSSASISTSSETRTSRQRVAAAVRQRDQALQALTADPENEELQSRLLTAEEEMDNALQVASTARSRSNPVEYRNTSEWSTPIGRRTDWDVRQSKALHLLVMSLSEYYKTLTVKCEDLKSTWDTLLSHFEGRAAADKLAAKRQLERILFSNANEISDSLNQLRLVRNTLAGCGALIPDEDLFLIMMELSGCALYKSDHIIVSTPRSNGFYQLHHPISKPQQTAFSSTDTIEIWHERLAHTPPRVIAEIVSKKSGTGISINLSRPKHHECKACDMGKSTRLPSYDRNPQHRSTAPGRVLHLDLCGSMQVASIQGARYSMPIVDEFSRFVTLYFLERKNETIGLILQRIDSYKNQFGFKVAVIQTDNAAELTSSYLKNGLSQRGVQLQTSVPSGAKLRSGAHEPDSSIEPERCFSMPDFRQSIGSLRCQVQLISRIAFRGQVIMDVHHSNYGTGAFQT